MTRTALYLILVFLRGGCSWTSSDHPIIDSKTPNISSIPTPCPNTSAAAVSSTTLVKTFYVDIPMPTTPLVAFRNRPTTTPAPLSNPSETSTTAATGNATKTERDTKTSDGSLVGTTLNGHKDMSINCVFLILTYGSTSGSSRLVLIDGFTRKDEALQFYFAFIMLWIYLVVKLLNYGARL